MSGQTPPPAVLSGVGELSYVGSSRVAGQPSALVDVLSCAPGSVVLWHSQYWHICEVREPSHGIAAAYGGEVVAFDYWSHERRAWVAGRTITVWPHDGNRWWVDVLSTEDVARCFPEGVPA